MDQAGCLGVSLEQKWRGEWEVFRGFAKGRERVFWVCVVGLMLVLTCVLTGLRLRRLLGGRRDGKGRWFGLVLWGCDGWQGAVAEGIPTYRVESIWMVAFS